MDKPVYIFDVDGVINDIHSYSIDNRVLHQIHSLLSDDCYVAINTGRGYAWVEEDVVQFLRDQPDANEKLNRFFIAVEMGGLTVEFIDGEEKREATAFSLQPEQITRVKQIYEKYKVDGVLNWYAGKLSMATIDKPAGVDPEQFLKDGKELVAAIENEFANERVKIKHNPDAIDITTPEAGKWAGAQLIHDWLQRTPAMKLSHFVCLGDNASDYEMARFFGRQNHTVDFVYTGMKILDIEHDENVNLIKTQSAYSQGTYEYLKSITNI